MAFRSIVSRLRGTATYATSTTTKLKAYAPTANFGYNDPHHPEKHTKKAVKGDYVPVYVALGMIAVSLSIGLYTAKQQIMHSPNVRVKKKLRETLPEVEDPDLVVNEADNFIKKSFFRKVAHIQEFDTGRQYLPDPSSRDAFAHVKPHAETLKSVGIDPKQQ